MSLSGMSLAPSGFEGCETLSTPSCDMTAAQAMLAIYRSNKRLRCIQQFLALANWNQRVCAGSTATVDFSFAIETGNLRMLIVTVSVAAELLL